MADFPDVDLTAYDALKLEFLEDVHRSIDGLIRLLTNGYGINLNPRILNQIYSIHPALLDDLNVDLSKR